MSLFNYNSIKSSKVRTESHLSSKTREKYHVYSRVLLRLFSGLEILVTYMRKISIINRDLSRVTYGVHRWTDVA